ncbi:MAG: hypothetical protein LBR26_00705 [Prevotella sp.]|nr:hypothetical protein [Prevotella sp.]
MNISPGRKNRTTFACILSRHSRQAKNDNILWLSRKFRFFTVSGMVLRMDGIW